MFQYPSDMIAPLRAGWEGGMPRDRWDLRPLPDDKQLQRLLEVAYHASFTVDEQRRTRFKLVVAEPTDTTGVHDPLVIEPRREFTTHEIMRLAPAADIESFVLGLDPADLAMWGMCRFVSQRLEVSALGPGFLRAGRSGLAIVALEAGRISTEGSLLGIDYQMLLDTFAEAQEALWEGIDYQPGGWYAPASIYPGELLGVASEIARHGHGGTMFVVPEADAKANDWRRLLRIKYRCDGESAAWTALQYWMRCFDSNTFRDAKVLEEILSTRTKVDALLGRIPSLSRVDGAVVITDRFRLLGFGAEVVAHAAINDVIGPDARTRSIEAYGTRHRSAFRFCATYPRGVAFVCSQDGGIRCIRNVDGRVQMWGR